MNPTSKRSRMNFNSTKVSTGTKGLDRLALSYRLAKGIGACSTMMDLRLGVFTSGGIG